jgi:ferrochelatase
MKKKGVLLVNLGTPDSPAPRDVRKYLLEFLTDGRVIDFPWLPRQLLVRGIIVPFRYRNSARLYKEVWDPQTGSPLLFHSLNLLDRVREQLPSNYVVELAMRYQSPSIESGLQALRAAQVDEITVLPLFPQYASSSTGTVMEKVNRLVSQWNAVPGIRMINSFYDHPLFIDAFLHKIHEHDLSAFDHVIFSYHGLPERHMRKVDETGEHCLQPNYACCESICGANRFCYRAHCMATTRLLTTALGLGPRDHTVSFQSRLGRDPWIQPYTSDVLKILAGKGHKRILVVCPAFVADCLETLYEISVEYQEEFEEAGGEKLQLVASLNDSPEWARAVCSMILNDRGGN